MNTGFNLFKGISKVSYSIVPSIYEAIKSDSNQKQLMGFSLWSHLSDQDFIDTLAEKMTKDGENPQNWAFIFGNEERGLPLKLQSEIPTFRLGEPTSEPLRSSQAAAYALGIFKAQNSMSE